MSEQEIQELLNRVTELTASVNELTEENARLRKKLDRMSELLLLAQQARFGQSSEKREYVLKGGEQMRLFNEAEQIQDPKAPEPTQETIVAAHTRKPKRPLDELVKDLPVKKIVLELGEDQRRCDACGSELTPIGEKFLRRELNIIPRKVEVIEYYTCTYACKPCEEKTGYANFYTVETVPPLLKHSLASPSSVANVMTQKYVDGIPLYRQEQIWKRDGIALSRATLANWVIQGSKWLKSLIRRMKASLVEGAVIHADETVVQVHKEEGKENTSESRMWVYTSGPFERRQVRYFEYQPDRSGKHPAALLKEFEGRLVTDGYMGYDQVSKATRCGCWAHMRRKWREALPRGATIATSKAAIGYEYCNKLFALERKYEGYSPKQRQEMRQAQTEPVLDAYWAWVEKLDPESGSKLEDAVKYARNQKQALNAFLRYGDVEISNNLAENAIRPFVVGRKNWLFCDTPKGAEASAIVYSLVETAKANNVEPFTYLSFVLNEIRWFGKTPAAAELDALLPWNTALRKRLEN